LPEHWRDISAPNTTEKFLCYSIQLCIINNTYRARTVSILTIRIYIVSLYTNLSKLENQEDVSFCLKQ